MVFPTIDPLKVPCLTSRMSPTAPEELHKKYGPAKKYGIRASFAFGILNEMRRISWNLRLSNYRLNQTIWI